MASLQEIRSRINAIESTRKITRAMNLVASAKLQRARKNFALKAEYFASVAEAFQNLSANVDRMQDLYPKKAQDRKFYILITSDLGLCGGYNSMMVRMAKELVRPGVDVLAVFGARGIQMLSGQGIKPDYFFEHVGDLPSYAFAASCAQRALERFQSGQVDSVEIIYTHFVNTLVIEPRVQRVLPVPKEMLSKAKKLSAVVAFEPSPLVVLKSIFPLYVGARIYEMLVESKVSEMSARRTAMESATDNAKQILDELRLQYNRERQSGITQEITEIVAGAEASV